MRLAPLPDVQREILDAVGVLAPVEVQVDEAQRLVLAADVSTDEDVPPFANTAMDGYAVRAADTSGASPSAPARLRVVDDLAAGRAPGVPVGEGQAIRIMTGAPMPAGADAVVMVERTAQDGDDVLIEAKACAGDHVRSAGGDLHAGDVAFAAGSVLSPAHVGVLASIGVPRVSAYPRARVGVLSTGDEIVAAEQPSARGPGPPARSERDHGPGSLEPGKIRDSNRPMLLALAREVGVEVVDLGIARDDEERIVTILEDALTRCDAVLTSGGVSVGDYDYVKSAIDRLGSLEWRQVAIKPAKPLAFGMVRGVPVFGLPGNPVSSLVSFELFARPALLKMMGHTRIFRPEVVARAEHEMKRRSDGKLHLDRVHVRDDGEGYVAARSGAQESNVLSATAAANGLALVPDGDGIAAGDPVRVMLIDEPRATSPSFWRS